MKPIESLLSILKDGSDREPMTTKQALIECLIQVWFHSEKNPEAMQNFDTEYARAC